jgi:hypothetical protein
VFSRKTFPVHPEDEKIVGIARELSTQLNYYKQDIRSVTWVDKIGFRRAPASFLLIMQHSLQLSVAAMGKLTPEEWRPIIASLLAYQKNMSREYLKAFLPLFAAGLLEPVILIPIVKYTALPRSFVFLDLAIGLIFVVIIMALFLSLRLQKKIWFKADDRAAEIVGKGLLISSLTKLAAIDSSPMRGQSLIRPNLQQRIQHLSA